MLKSRLNQLRAHGCALMHAEIDAQDVNSLFHAGVHPMRLTLRRSSMIISRTQFVAVLLVLSLLLLMVITVYTHPSGIWSGLVLPPLSAAIMFMVIAVSLRGRRTLRSAYVALLSLFAVAVVFFLVMQFQVTSMHGGQLAITSTAYAYLPFIMLVALGMFPLTVVEGGSLAATMLFTQAATIFAAPGRGDWDAGLAALITLITVAVIAVLAGLSQLSLLVLLVKEAIHDSLTGCYSRCGGEELLELQYAWANRSNGRLAVALVSLDNFQEVNFRSGYRLGDVALKKAAEVLHDSVRSGDMLIRWSGDQFLLVLPNASIDQASGALQRLLSTGLGVRPDGGPLTASIGIAERTHDATQDWWKLLDLAGSRVRVARQRGGNCTVAC